MDPKASKKEVQKEATKRALLKALEQELALAPRLIVERIATRAGVNKALVYRYFEGLNGLLTAFGNSTAFMPDAAELLDECPPDLAARPALERFVLCLKAYITALSKRPATVQILLRFPHLDPAVKEALMAGRVQSINSVRAVFRTAEAALPFDLDSAFNLLISGACVQLASDGGDPESAAPMGKSGTVHRLHQLIEAMLYR